VSDHAEQLVVRQKDLMDNATPSANSVAAVAFLRLSALTADNDLYDKAVQILKLLARVSPSAPTAFCNAAYANSLLEHGVTEIVIPGIQPSMMNVLRSQWLPLAVTAWGEPTESPLWEGRTEGMAYVCRDHVCLLPAHTPDELQQRIVTNASGE
jgi:uncharacterized protein YyaL (SSP411 family)